MSPAVPAAAPVHLVGPLKSLEELAIASVPAPWATRATLRDLRHKADRMRGMTQEEGRRLAWLEKPEAELQGELKKFMVDRGWLYYHTKDSRQSDFGFLDTVGLRASDQREVIIECKREHESCTNEQLTWLSTYMVLGREVYVLRPSGLAYIEEVLL